MSANLKIEFEGDMKQLRAELKKVLRDVDDTGEKGGKGFGSKFTQGFKDAFSGFTVANLATRGIDAAIAGVTAAFDEMLAREQSLAEFSAITGVVGEDLKSFGDLAEEMSNKFGGPFLDQMDAFKGILSRLGPQMAQDVGAMRSMTDSVNTLSKASGLNATQSMEALTTAMLQFGVDLNNPTEAAAEMARMMNVMAAGAKEGAAEVPQVSQAIAQFGSVAHDLGVSFEESNALIQAAAAAGKYGSEAGTQIKGILLSLTTASGPAEQALNGIGLSVSDLSRVLTEQGAEAALKLLNDKLEQVPDLAQRAAIKTMVFGRENVATASGIMRQVAANGLLTDALTGTETATEQAAVTMATKQEMMRRTSTQAWNGVVQGVTQGVDVIVQKIGYFINSIQQTIDIFVDLYSLDFAGFWDKLTTSVDKYADAKERAAAAEEKQYRALSAQADKEIADTEARANRAKNLQIVLEEARKTGKYTTAQLGELYDEAKQFFTMKPKASPEDFWLRYSDATKKVQLSLDELKQKRNELETSKRGATSRAMRDAIQAKIDDLNAQIEAIDPSKKKEGKKDSPLAGTIGAMEEDLRELERKVKNVFLPMSAESLAASAKIKVLSGEIRVLNAAMEMDPTDIKLEKISQRVNTLDKSISAISTIEISVRTTGIDASISTLEAMFIAAEAAGLSVSTLGDIMGSAVANGSDGLKQALKAAGSMAITFAEGMITVADGVSLAQAIMSGGLTLFKDAPLLALAGVALEGARAYINSLDKGGILMEDQLIQAHARELVLPLDKAPQFFAEAVSRGAGSANSSAYSKPYQPPQRVYNSGTIKLDYGELQRGQRNAAWRSSSRVG